jgi:hypothetical protein
MTGQQESLERYIKVLQEQLEKCRSVRQATLLTRELLKMEDQLQRLKILETQKKGIT